MATTWIKPLHVNKRKSIAHTLGKRTDYAGNPDKTNDGELIRGFGCDPRTVDEEFLLAKKEYEYLTGRNNGQKNVLAYHIRQAFKPGEITPKEALEVGYELAGRFTKNKHAFIVAVHTDKAHIHCHIIFNSTTLDGKKKFNNFFGSSFALRRLSDLICAEHGLSIIEQPETSKGKNYGKWLGDKKEPSWQDKLRRKIDEVLPRCATFDDFISVMKAAGYEVNTKRKHITFLAPGQSRPTRLNTLRGDYMEAAIRERFEEKAAEPIITAPAGKPTGSVVTASSIEPAEPIVTASVIEPAPSSASSVSFVPARVNLLIDIQAKIREGKGAGYEQWARIFNIKEAARTLLFLKDNGIDSYDDLVKKASASSVSFSALSEKIKNAEKRMAGISELQKYIGTYGKTRDVYAQYRKSSWNAKFYEEHRGDITLHQAAKKYFNDHGYGKDKKLPTISSLKQEYAALLSDKKKCYADYREAKESMKSLLVAKGNADRILGVKPEAQTCEAVQNYGAKRR